MKRVKVIVTAEAVVPDHIARRVVDSQGGPRDAKVLAQMVIEGDKNAKIEATYPPAPPGERL